MGLTGGSGWSSLWIRLPNTKWQKLYSNLLTVGWEFIGSVHCKVKSVTSFRLIRCSNDLSWVSFCTVLALPSWELGQSIHTVAKVTSGSFLFMLCHLSNSGSKRAPLPKNSSKTLGMPSCWNNFGKVPNHELIFVVRWWRRLISEVYVLDHFSGPQKLGSGPSKSWNSEWERNTFPNENQGY